MDYSHVQQLTEGSRSQDSLDYKWNTLIEIADQFRMEYNEELKRELKETLRNKLKGLVLEFKSKITKLEDIVVDILQPSY